MPLPKSLPWMESVDAKISRAHEHLDTLEREIRVFLESTKHNFVVKVDEKHAQMEIVYWVDDPYPPIRFSALVGDCVFNMRSALDHMVCGLIRTKNPGSSCAGRSFPICTDRNEYLKTKE